MIKKYEKPINEFTGMGCGALAGAFALVAVLLLCFVKCDADKADNVASHKITNMQKGR